MNKVKVENLICGCCGCNMRGRQWWNIDNGYGLCTNCIPYCKKGETEDSFKLLFGVDGYHFNIKDNT